MALRQLATAFLVLAVACRPAERLHHVQKTAQIMGSTFLVEIYDASSSVAEQSANAALDEIRRIDRILSDYRADSELSHVNATAAVSAVEVSPELFSLLQDSQRYSAESGGAFDMSVGALMRVWGFYKGSGTMPGAVEVAAALQQVGYKNVLLDSGKRTVRFGRPGLSLDPGGIGKGYAVDRAVHLLKRNHIRCAFISAGGSSIYGMGAPPQSPQGWRVHLQNPWNPDNIRETVYLRDRSLSTSGAFEKFFWANGHIYSHIMDPRTGYPATGVVSVSIAAPNTIDSEVWAKPYFIQGRKWATQHKPRTFSVYMCEDISVRTCSWLSPAR